MDNGVHLFAAEEFELWWQSVGLAPQNFVYQMFDSRGHTLYVGITNNLRNRLSAHYAEKPWIEEVATVKVERYETREASKQRESDLIREVGPVYNLAENQRLSNVVSYYTSKLASECPAAAEVGVQLAAIADRQYRGSAGD